MSLVEIAAVLIGTLLFLALLAAVVVFAVRAKDQR